jgi:ribosomal protein L21E
MGFAIGNIRPADDYGIPIGWELGFEYTEGHRKGTTGVRRSPESKTEQAKKSQDAWQKQQAEFRKLPKEGDTKTENGKQYVLRGGRWHVNYEDPKAEEKAFDDDEPFMLKPEPSKWEVPEVQKPDPDIKKIPAAGEIQGSLFDAGKKTDLPGQNMLFSDPIDPDNSKTAEAQAAKVGLEAKFDSMKSHNDEVHRLAAEKGLHREAIAGWPSELGDGYDNGQSPAETLATIEKAMADEAKEIAEARAKAAKPGLKVAGRKYRVGDSVEVNDKGNPYANRHGQTGKITGVSDSPLLHHVVEFPDGKKEEYHEDELKDSAGGGGDSPEHAELLEKAAKFSNYGPDYDRNIASSLGHYQDAKKRGHDQKMLDHLHGELKVRMEGKESREFLAKAKKAIDDKLSSGGNVGNVWSSVKDATGKGIGDMSPEERRVLKDHAEGRRAIEKPEPSDARAKAMAAQTGEAGSRQQSIRRLGGGV